MNKWSTWTMAVYVALATAWVLTEKANKNYWQRQAEEVIAQLKASQMEHSKALNLTRESQQTAREAQRIARECLTGGAR